MQRTPLADGDTERNDWICSSFQKSPVADGAFLYAILRVLHSKPQKDHVQSHEKNTDRVTSSSYFSFFSGLLGLLTNLMDELLQVAELLLVLGQLWDAGRSTLRRWAYSMRRTWDEMMRDRCVC